MNLIALLTGAGLATALIGWPRYGLLARWRENRSAAARIRREDALKHLLKCEANGAPATSLSLGGALGLRESGAAALLRMHTGKYRSTFDATVVEVVGWIRQRYQGSSGGDQ